MDIAIECARLQHRFTLPPLEVERSPQFGTSLSDHMGMPQSCFNNGSPTGGTDILDEILSVAQAQQDLLNHSNDCPWGDMNTSSIPVGDHQDESNHAGRMVDYLDLVVMSERDFEKVR